MSGFILWLDLGTFNVIFRTCSIASFTGILLGLLEVLDPIDIHHCLEGILEI